jgi:hypothetical protein
LDCIIDITDAFHNRVHGIGLGNPGLSLRNVPAPVGVTYRQRKHAGIPGTVFICTGDDNANGANTTEIVITTSRDFWEGYGRVHAWVNTNRLTLSRLGWRANPRDNLNVRIQSTQIRTAFANIPNLANLTAANRLIARQGVKNQANWVTANHGAELAKPMSCPLFQDKARCLRCQTLFRYNVLANVAALENNLLAAAGAHSRTGLFCAETIAHYCCTDAPH